MFSTLLTWVLLTAVGQAPAEAAWLKVLPADSEVVLHVRGVTETRDDIAALLKALSPALADQAQAGLDMAADHVKERFGEKAASSPFFVALRLPKAEDMQSPPAFVILMPSVDYDGFLKSLAGPGGEGKPEKQTGGYDAITAGDGEKIFVLKGDGYVAFSPLKDDMLKAIAAKPSENFAGKAKADSVKLLLAGDVGVYVNLEAVQRQYGEQIEEGKKTFLALLDQAGAQAGGNAQIEQAKAMYATMFDSLKVAESVTLSVDFDKEAFDLSGLLTVKPDSESAKTLKTAKLGSGSQLGKLPANQLAYMYLNFDPAGMEGLLKLNASAIGGQADAEALKKSLENFKAAGRQETVASFSLAQPVEVFSLTTAENIEKAIAATRASLADIKSSSPVIKDVKIEENALDYKGFKLSKSTMTLNIDKLAEMQVQGNEQALEMMKRFLGPGVITTYFGSDGKRIVSVVAASEAEVKARLDAALGDASGIDQSAGYKAARSRLPNEVGGLVIVNAQEIVKQFGALFGRLTGGEVPTPAMPKETAYFGMSFAATPAGYRFDFVLPSAVGPVFEQGFGTLMQAVQGQINQ